MNIRKIFVDANVIIDMLDKSRKQYISANKVITYCVTKNIELYTSCDLITTVYYVLSKKDKKRALNNIKYTSDIFELIPFSNDKLDEAVYIMETNPEFKDLEDTLQYVLAKKEKCDLILTNNKEFYSPDIKIYTTNDFLKKLNSKGEETNE